MSTSFWRETRKLFGQKLRSARERAGFRFARQLADRLGVEPNTYRCWERGSAEPNLAMLRRIASELNVPLDYLLPPERPKPQVPFRPEDQKPRST